MSCQKSSRSLQTQSKPIGTLNPQHQSLQIYGRPSANTRKLHEFSLQISLKKKKSKNQRGLIYSNSPCRSSSFDKESYVSKSLKIDCREPASIVTHLKDLNGQYFPRRKENIAQRIKRLCILNEQLVFGSDVSKSQAYNVRLSREWQESWDIIQQRKKSEDRIWTLLLLIILLCVLSQRIRDSCFGGYSALRQLV